MKATIAAGLVFITLFVSKVLPAAVIVDEGSGKEPQQEGTHSNDDDQQVSGKRIRNNLITPTFKANKHAKMTINDIPDPILEDIASMLDIPSHSTFASVNRRFSETARSEASWAGVTSLKINMGKPESTLQITNRNGRIESTDFRNTRELFTKSRALMSRCRKLEELVLTGDGHFKFGESSFDQLFEPLQSYLPNNNSNPPPEAQLDEAKQIPFPSLAHFSIFHLMDINSSKLFARLSRLVPLRGLHSLSFENNYPDTPGEKELHFLKKFFVDNPRLELLNLNWEFSLPLIEIIPPSVKFLKIYFFSNAEQPRTPLPTCFQHVRALVVKCVNYRKIEIEIVFACFSSLFFLDLDLSGQPSNDILANSQRSLHRLKALRIIQTKQQSLLTNIASACPELEHLNLSRVSDQIYLFPRWDFSPLARLSRLQSFLLRAEISFKDGAKLIEYLPKTLQALALYGWNCQIYKQLEILSERIKNDDLTKLREIRLSITQFDQFDFTNRPNSISRPVDDLVHEIRKGLDLIEEILEAKASSKASSSVAANPVLHIFIVTYSNSNKVKDIEKDTSRKWVQFHSIASFGRHMAITNDCDIFWMEHGVPVAKAQLNNPPKDSTFYNSSTFRSRRARLMPRGHLTPRDRIRNLYERERIRNLLLL